MQWMHNLHLNNKSFVVSLPGFYKSRHSPFWTVGRVLSCFSIFTFFNSENFSIFTEGGYKYGLKGTLAQVFLKNKYFQTSLFQGRVYMAALRLFQDHIVIYCCQYFYYNTSIPVGIYLLKVNNRNTRTRREICSKLTIKTPERRHWRRPGVFIVNFEHLSHLVLVFLLLTLNM